MKSLLKEYAVPTLLAALVAAVPLAVIASGEAAHGEGHGAEHAEAAGEAGAAPGDGEGGHEEEDQSFSHAMMHHLKDGYDVEVPFQLHKVVHLDQYFDWRVKIGEYEINLTPTRHLLFVWVAAVLVFLFFVLGRRSYDENGVPRGGFMNFLEALVIFVRDDIAVRNIGKKDGPYYTPFLCSLFFLILFMNLLGLLPWGAGATSNLMVTGALAFCSFVMTQYAGMRAQGVIGYWAHLVPSGVPAFLYPIMIPIEFIGLFTKPFALMMRLFANMTAGHAVIISFIGLIFMLQTIYISPVAIGFATFIYLLKIFVSFLQAYLFAMLTALFIGLASHPH